MKVGPDCGDEFSVGQRVCCENHFYCGKCYQCLHGKRAIRWWCQVLLNLTNSERSIPIFMHTSLLFNIAGYISHLATILVRCRVLGIAWPISNSLFLDLFCLTDLRHICQNLNQFGHGRGTIYGGKKLLSVLVTSQIQWHELLIRIFESNLLDVFSAGFAQYTIIPARYCYKLKTNLDVNRACLLERKRLNVQIISLRFIVTLCL